MKCRLSQCDILCLIHEIVRLSPSNILKLVIRPVTENSGSFSFQIYFMSSQEFMCILEVTYFILYSDHSNSGFYLLYRSYDATQFSVSFTVTVVNYLQWLF